MQLSKPDVARVLLTARDVDGQSKSETITIYETTPAKTMGAIKQLIAAIDAAGLSRVTSVLKELAEHSATPARAT